MLWATQLLRIAPGIRDSDGAIRPREPPLGGLIDGPTPRRGAGENARLAFDQDIPDIARRFADEGNPLGGCSCPGKDLLRARSGFAKAAPRQDQPDFPGLWWW